MAEWPNDLLAPASSTPEVYPRRISRPLQVVSGNSQSFALDRPEGSEKENPRQPLTSEVSFTNAKVPAAGPALHPNSSTNDGPTIAERLQHRHRRRQKQHRQHGAGMVSKGQDRSYMFCKNFIDYRTRLRKDIGKDDKQIWPDHIESAFHEGWHSPVGIPSVFQTFTLS